MLLQNVTSSWAEQANMIGFPLWPKRLPTMESFEHGEFLVYEWRWLRTVRWARVPAFKSETETVVLEDAFWLD